VVAIIFFLPYYRRYTAFLKGHRSDILVVLSFTIFIEAASRREYILRHLLLQLNYLSFQNNGEVYAKTASPGVNRNGDNNLFEVEVVK